MNAELNNQLNGKNGVYYEYRETFYRVDDRAREYESNCRETYDDCAVPMRRALKMVTKYVEMSCGALYGWDLVTVEILRYDLQIGEIKTLFESHLFADDFAD